MDFSHELIMAIMNEGYSGYRHGRGKIGRRRRRHGAACQGHRQSARGEVLRRESCR